MNCPLCGTELLTSYVGEYNYGLVCDNCDCKVLTVKVAK